MREQGAGVRDDEGDNPNIDEKEDEEGDGEKEFRGREWKLVSRRIFKSNSP